MDFPSSYQKARPMPRPLILGRQRSLGGGEVKNRSALDNQARVINILLTPFFHADPFPSDPKTDINPEADMRRYPTVLALGGITLTWPVSARSHCEIPCGIYDDRARVQLIAEHVRTIEKSIQQVLALQKAETVNYNQLMRWVMNKENHATEIQTIVSQYFMTQRIKPDSDQYAQKIAVLHRMLISAMKCKQTTDLKHVAELRELLTTFDRLYFK